MDQEEKAKKREALAKKMNAAEQARRALEKSLCLLVKATSAMALLMKKEIELYGDAVRLDTQIEESRVRLEIEMDNTQEKTIEAIMVATGKTRGDLDHEAAMELRRRRAAGN